MPRGSSSSDLKKKRDLLFKKAKDIGGNKKYEQNRSNNTNGGNDKKKVTTTKKLTGAERAKALAKKNIKKYGGTAKAAAANKEAMRLKIRQRYLANKKKKK